MARGAEAYLQMWERTEGVPMRRCVPARSRLTRRGLEDIQIGRNVETLLRRAGQPDRRPARAWTFCAMDGKRERTVTAVLSGAGRVTLVGSKLRRAQGEHDRHRRPRLAAAAQVRRQAVRRKSTCWCAACAAATASSGACAAGRVRWTAVAAGSVAKDPRELRRALRLAGLR